MNATKTLTPPVIDNAVIRSHVELIHSLAAPLAGNGKLVLACFAEDPDQPNPKTGKPGLPLPPVISHFAVGDVDTMTRTIGNLAIRPHVNAYAPLVVFQSDLRPGGKGFEKDILAVLGLVADFDDPNAARWAERLPIPPNYVLETSAGRFQAFYLFDEPTPFEIVKPIAERLKAFAGCDHGTADLSHVWRVAGSLNWPNGKKVHEGGRARDPQSVRAVLPWDGTLTSIADLAALLPEPAEPEPPPFGEEDAPGGDNGQQSDTSGAEPSLELIMKLLPDKLRKRITEPGSGDRSRALYSVIKALGEHGLDAPMIERIIRAHPNGIGAKYVDRHDLDREIARVLSKASKRDAAEAEVAESRRGKPVVRIFGGGLVTAIDEAEQALLTRDNGVFQRGDFVVRVAPVAIPIADDRETVGLRLIQIKAHHMVERFTHAIDFQKFDCRTEDYVSIDCPFQLAATYLQRIGSWRLPILTGISSCPTLRPDGSILDQPGYDLATGILYNPRGVQYPPIPLEPSKEEALAALGELKQLIRGFPFVPDDPAATNEDAPSASRSVALSGMATAVIRRSIRTAPLHAYTAPVAGSGKSKLVDLCSMTACGHEAPVISQGKTEEEFEKRLDASLIAGDAVISVDNCDAPLGGDLLCQSLTQQILQIRILGKSEKVLVPNTAMFCANGNNLAISGDMTRRAIVCSLDPKCERPETREFDEDPVETVRLNRAKYVAAVLTILRAYIVAGRPPQKPPLGSFEQWSRLVRDALIWLGEPDPCTTMDRARAEDPRLRELTGVLRLWHEAIGTDSVTVDQLIDRATDYVPQQGIDFNRTARRPEFVFPELREQLLVVAGSGGAINSYRLGKWLGRHKGRIVNGLRIMEGHAGQTWRIVCDP